MRVCKRDGCVNELTGSHPNRMFCCAKCKRKQAYDNTDPLLRAERQRKDYLKNQEARKAAARSRYADNREEFAAEKRAARAADPEGHRARGREYYRKKNPLPAARSCMSSGCHNLVQGHAGIVYCTPECGNRFNAKQWRENHPELFAEHNKQYREDNPEKIRSYYRKYAASPKGRARGRRASNKRRTDAGSTVPQSWVRRTDHDDSLCYWCGSDDVAHVDHVMPISLGGPATESKEVPSCADCNLRKNAKHPLVWIVELIERA